MTSRSSREVTDVRSAFLHVDPSPLCMVTESRSSCCDDEPDGSVSSNSPLVVVPTVANKF